MATRLDRSDRTSRTAGAGGGGAPLNGRQRRAQARLRAAAAQADNPAPRGVPTVMVVIGVVALVALVVGVALATGFLTPPGSSSATAAPVASLHTVLRAPAADVVAEDGSGWVVEDQHGTIRRFDPASGAWEGRPVPVGNYPVSVAAGYGKLWVADSVGNAVVAVNPTTGKVVGRPISVGQNPVSIAAGEGGIWVASLGADTVSLINPTNRTVTASVALPDGAVRVALGDKAVWVTGTTDTLTRIRPRPVGVSLDWRVVRVGQGPIGLAVAPGAVWVGNALGGTVSRVDPSTLRVTATYRLGGDPAQVAVFDNEVWVADGESGALKAFDPSDAKQVGKQVQLAGGARRLVASGGSLWATTGNPGSVVSISPG